MLLYLWALPNTLIGFVLGAVSFQRPRLDAGVMVFDRAARGFLWLLPRFRRSAITFGHVVLSTHPVQGTLRAHERHHVCQYEAMGPLYLPAYLLVYPFTGYRRHPFEVAARAAEAVTPAGPPSGPA